MTAGKNMDCGSIARAHVRREMREKVLALTAAAAADEGEVPGREQRRLALAAAWADVLAAWEARDTESGSHAPEPATWAAVRHAPGSPLHGVITETGDRQYIEPMAVAGIRARPLYFHPPKAMECRSVTQETVEDAWSVGTWYLEYLKDEGEGGCEEAAICRRLLRSIPPGRVPWVHPNQRLDESAPATEQESVSLKRQDAIAIRVLLSRLAAGIAPTDPDSTRRAEVLAGEIERQLQAMEEKAVSGEENE